VTESSIVARHGTGRYSPLGDYSCKASSYAGWPHARKDDPSSGSIPSSFGGELLGGWLKNWLQLANGGAGKAEFPGDRIHDRQRRLWMQDLMQRRS
jgi:hypothetical protein